MPYRVIVEIIRRGTLTLDDASNPHEACLKADKMLKGPEPEEVLDTEPTVVSARGIQAYPIGEIRGPE